MRQRSTRLLPALVAVVLGVALLPSGAASQKAEAERDAFFRSGKVLEIKITLDPKELESLRREPRKYVKATVKEGDREYKDVGIHLKGGAGSYRDVDDKPGLTLNFHKYLPEQRFRGMEKLHLANSVQDGSYVSELICGDLFRAAGVPAARIGHAVVFVNGKRKGLYYIKEGYDKFFKQKSFGNRDGNFYDGGFLRDIDQPLELLSSKGDVPMHADLKALVQACNEADRKKRFEKLEKLLDLAEFISFLSLEVITWDWDGYPMKRNNYRVYHDPRANKIKFIPSGMDQMFGEPNGSLFPGMEGLVARALLETPEGKKRYLARTAEIMDKVYRPDAILKQLDELQKRVQPALASIDEGAGRDYPNQIRRLRDAVVQREKSIKEQLRREMKAEKK